MFTVADASEEDLPGILALYNQVIATSTAVYSEQPVTLEERRTLDGEHRSLTPSVEHARRRRSSGPLAWTPAAARP
jgi:L-amino acid N-acyltransferase YncA